MASPLRYREKRGGGGMQGEGQGGREGWREGRGAGKVGREVKLEV
jgi:hypothetical protein